jgi:hypothetical protein
VPKKKTLSIQTGPTFYDETTEDEVDESQMSYRGSLTPYKEKKASKKKAHHTVTEDSE